MIISKSLCAAIRCAFGSIINYGANLFLPLRIRRVSIFFPDAERERFKNPCVVLRFRLLGWYVIDIPVGIRDNDLDCIYPNTDKRVWSIDDNKDAAIHRLYTCYAHFALLAQWS